MNHPYRICVLGYEKLSVITQEALQDLHFNDTEIEIVDTNVETLVPVVRAQLEKGCDVFVAGSGNAAAFRRNFQYPLIELKLGDIDYLVALSKAFTIGKNPLFITYRYAAKVNTELFSALLGTEIFSGTYEDSTDLVEVVRQDGVDVIIGAGYSVKVANELGKKSVLISPSQETIQSAIRQARQRAIVQRQELQNQEIIKAIVSQPKTGIIVTNEDGLITLFNRAAQTMTGYPAKAALGSALEKIIPSLSGVPPLSAHAAGKDTTRLINEAMLTCRQSNLTAQGASFGILTTIGIDNRRQKKGETLAEPVFSVSGEWSKVIARSDSMSKCEKRAKELAVGDKNICIVGEESTGRTMLAECIHNHSERATMPCVVLDLAMVPDGEMVSYLLGMEHDDGIRYGLFELVSGGTVVLRNYASASPLARKIIQNVLSGRPVLRVNGRHLYKLDVRFLTVVDQAELALVQRQYELCVFTLSVPPLRERKEDLREMFEQFFVGENNQWLRPPRKIVTPEIQALLNFHDWPGNMSELRRCCKRYADAWIQHPGATPKAKHLMIIEAIGEEIILNGFLDRNPVLRESFSTKNAEAYQQTVEELKRLLVLNNAEVAERLGLSRTSLWRYLKDTKA